MSLFRTRAVEDVVDHYVERRSTPTGQVSTRHAVTAIRMIVPGCSLSDKELADMVAASAVSRGCAVAFDMSKTPLD